MVSKISFYTRRAHLLTGLFCILSLFILTTFAPAMSDDRLTPYLNTLQEKSVTPVQYVSQKMNEYDLLIFDDAHHQAKEPFEFYQQLIRDPRINSRNPVIFVELFDVMQQPHIDAFLDNDTPDLSLLYPVFRASYTPYAINLKTYFDLMTVIFEVNRGRPKDQRLRVLGVSTPALWPMIQNPADYAAFQQTLSGRDHDMYRRILSGLNNFSAGKKGIFFTNTRHAYTGIKDKTGSFFWNTTTFFRQWHPGKSYSLRIHGPQLFIEKSSGNGDKKDIQGLSNVIYRFGRMEKGLWDTAFQRNGNIPAAFDLKGTPFGAAAYVGNHMLRAANGQTIADAYDGLVFLKPLEELTNSAYVDWMYNTPFRAEVARRMLIQRSADELSALLKSNNVNTLEELILKDSLPENEKPLIDTQSLGAMDAWRND